MINAYHNSTIENGQGVVPYWIRISRHSLILISQLIRDSKQQSKDGIIKAFLSRLGVGQSRHIKKHTQTLYKNKLTFFSKVKRNYIEMDLNLLNDAFKILRASEVFQLIQLASWCKRSNSPEKIVMAPWELKNLLSGALGKQTINRNLGELDKAGLIDLRRGGVGRYGQHYYSKWIIKIELFIVRFKTVNTSLLNSYFLVSNSFKSTFIGILKAMPPPKACPFKDDEIEKAFTDLLPALPYTQEDYEWYCLTQNKIDRKKAIKNIAKKARGLKAILEKAIKRHGLWNRNCFGKYEIDPHNPHNALTSFDSFWRWLPTLPNYKQIKNLTGAIIADLKGRRSIYDQFLKWADARHEANKINARRPQKKTPEQIEDDKRWQEYVERQEQEKRIRELKKKQEQDEKYKGMTPDEERRAIIKEIEERENGRI